MAFKVGDKVRAVNGTEGLYPSGAVGTIRYVQDNEALVDWLPDSGAAFDAGASDYAWFASLSDLAFAQETPESAPVSPRAAILDEAKALITGDRNNQYGPPTQDFARTAEFWTTYLGDKLKDDATIEAHDIAAMMTLLKLSRITWSADKRDSWADAAGYIGCGWECVVDEQKGAEDGE